MITITPFVLRHTPLCIHLPLTHSPLQEHPGLRVSFHTISWTLHCLFPPIILLITRSPDDVINLDRMGVTQYAVLTPNLYDATMSTLRSPRPKHCPHLLMRFTFTHRCMHRLLPFKHPYKYQLSNSLPPMLASFDTKPEELALEFLEETSQTLWPYPSNSTSYLMWRKVSIPVV